MGRFVEYTNSYAISHCYIYQYAKQGCYCHFYLDETTITDGNCDCNRNALANSITTDFHAHGNASAPYRSTPYRSTTHLATAYLATTASNTNCSIATAANTNRSIAAATNGNATSTQYDVNPISEHHRGRFI